MAVSLRLGSWSIRVVGLDAPVDDEGLVVVEEDRHRVLSAPAAITDRPDHPIRIMTALWSFEPDDLGAVIEQRPRRWSAIVYDLDHDPIVEPMVVQDTLRKVFDRAGEAGIDRVALRPWGLQHGPWSLEESLAVFRPVLTERWRQRPRILYLRVPDGLIQASEVLLRDD